MDKLIHAGSFQLFNQLFRETGHHHLDFRAGGFQGLSRGRGDIGVLLVAAAKHNDVGFGFEGRFHAFVHAAEPGSVGDFITGASEEVGAEASPCLAHGQVAGGEQEDVRTVSFFRFVNLGCQSQVFKSIGATVRLHYFINRSGAGAVSIFLFLIGLNLIQHIFRHIGILVGSQHHGAARGNLSVFLRGARGHAVLDKAGLNGFGHASFFFHFEEELPGGVGQRSGEVFDVVGAGGGVNHLIEARFFLQDNLLVAGHTHGESIRFLVVEVERKYRNHISAAQRGRHGLGGGAQHVYVRIVNGFVPVGCHRMDAHFGAFGGSGLILFHNACPQ